MGRTLALILGTATPFLSCGDTPLSPSPSPQTPSAKSKPAQDAQREETKTTPIGDLPERVAIGSIRAIDCSSTVVYASAPDRPHRLNATYAFPDRARWWLGIGDESSPERQMRMRYGDLVYAVDKQGATSRELLAPERTECVVQLELRRALLLWPLGFEWQRAERESTAPLAGLGRLTAHFADEHAQNPAGLSFTATDGKPGDEFRAIQWRADQGKVWPTALEFWHERELVWTETVRSIDTRTRFIDSYFLPPDRRDGGGSQAIEIGAVRGTDLQECRVQRLALEPGITFQAAFEIWSRDVAKRGEALKERGFALDDKVTLEVSRTAGPAAILLRLAPTTAVLPQDLAETFARVPERPALTTFVMGIQNVGEAELSKLLGAVPADAVGGTPYVRFDPKKPDQHVLIVLPLAAREK